jgi:hypothetical protein
MEHRLLMQDGRVKHIHVIARAAKTGNLDFVGAVTDITAAKKAEEKIRQSEKEARQLFGKIRPTRIEILNLAICFRLGELRSKHKAADLNGARGRLDTPQVATNA